MLTVSIVVYYIMLRRHIREQQKICDRVRDALASQYVVAAFATKPVVTKTAHAILGSRAPVHVCTEKQFFSHKKKLEMVVYKERNRRKYHALEVRRFVSGKSTHIGYIRFRFTRKEEAARFYNTYNPHMPPLTEERNWISECDPITLLFYIVTELDRVALTIAPFAYVECMQTPWAQPATQRVEPFPRCLRCIF